MLIYCSIPILIIIIGAIMVGINIKKCYFSGYIEADGMIVDYERRDSYDSEHGHSVTYTPVIEYEVDGVTYHYISSFSSSSKPKIGNMVTIMCNPDDPNKCVRKNDLSGVYFMGFGILFIVLILFFFNK